MIKLFVVLLFCTSGLCIRERPYVDYKLIRISTTSQESVIRILSNLPNSDFLEHDDAGIVVLSSPTDATNITRVMRGEGANVTILDDNLQISIDEEFRQYDLKRQKRSVDSLQDAVQRYLTLEEVYQFQDQVVTSCNKMATVEKETIGHSVENRPINVIKISKAGGKKKKTMFIEAGIHAREWLSPATANYIIYQLACNSQNDDLLELFDWQIVPVLNPDGYHFTHQGSRMWRKNRQKNVGSRCVGTDLNRNFGAGFGGKGSSKDPCSETYRGTHAYSAPESRAVKDHVMKIKDTIVSYLTLHTYGQYILLPYSYKSTIPKDFKSLKTHAMKAVKAMKTRFTVGTGFKTLYPAAGVSSDFAREEAGIARSYCWELMPKRGSKSGSGFAPKERMVPEYTETIWRGITAYTISVADELAAILESSSGGPSRASAPANIDPFLWNVLQNYRGEVWYQETVGQLNNVVHHWK